MNPLVGILSRLAHIHRQVHAVAEMHEVGKVQRYGIAPISMAGVHHLVVELRILEDREVAVPLRTAQHHDVVLIDFADSLGDAHIKWFESSIEFIEFLCLIGSNRLIQQVVADYDGVVGIMGGNTLPDVATTLLLAVAASHSP